MHIVLPALMFLASLAVARPSPVAMSLEDETALLANSANISDVFRSQEEIHNLVMSKIEPYRIVSRDQVTHELLRSVAKRSLDGDDAVYDPERRVWYSSIRDDAYLQKDFNRSIETRQSGPGDCIARQETRVLATHENWGPWHAIGPCQYNSAYTQETTESISWSVGGGIAGALSTGVLGASASFAIEKGYAVTRAHSCQPGNPGGDVVQLWWRTRYFWAKVDVESCNSCWGCVPSLKRTSYVSMPAGRNLPEDYQAPGCSAYSRGDVLLSRAEGRAGC